MIRLRRTLLLLLLLAVALPAFTAETPRELARRILADAKFQKEIPGRRVESGAKAAPRRPKPPPSPTWQLHLPSVGGLAAVKMFFWVLVAVLAALLLIWIGNLTVRAVQRRRRASDAQALVPAEPEATPHQVEPTIEEAQRLAREGCFAEAVHVLLLAAIRRVAERGKRIPQPHQTSRELLRVLPLGPESRQAFRELVVTVEGAHFGGAEVEEADFARSLERYRALAEGRSGGA